MQPFFNGNFRSLHSAQVECLLFPKLAVRESALEKFYRLLAATSGQSIRCGITPLDSACLDPGIHQDAEN